MNGGDHSQAPRMLREDPIKLLRAVREMAAHPLHVHTRERVHLMETQYFRRTEEWIQNRVIPNHLA